MTRAMIAILFLLSLCLYVNADDQIWDSRANELFGLTDKNYTEEDGGLRITDVPKDVKKGKCTVMKNISRIVAMRKDKLKLKEGTLVLWIHYPKITKDKSYYESLSDDGKTEALCVFLGQRKDMDFESLTDIDSGSLLLWARFDANVDGFGDDGIGEIESSCFFTTSLTTKCGSMYADEGWHQVAVSFSGRMAATFIDGVFAGYSYDKSNSAKDENETFIIDNLILENGKKDESDTDMGLSEVGLHRIELFDKCLKFEEVRAYRTDGTLPDGVKSKWEIKFDKKTPAGKSTKLSLSKNIDYEKVSTKE